MAVTDLVDDRGFRIGLAVGVVLLVVVWLVAAIVAAARHRAKATLPVAGIGIAGGVLVAADRTGSSFLLSDRLTIGIAALVIGPTLAAIALRRGPSAAIAAACAAVPGAVLVGSAAGLENDASWVPPFVAIWTVVAGALVADADRANARAGLGTILLPISVLGMWATVPDTEQVVVVVGIVVPLVLLGWPIARAALGPGTYATVGLLAWVAAVGGRGRPGSVVGSAACLGLLLVEPVGRRWWRGRAARLRSPLGRRTLLAVGLHVGVVAVTARVAGLEESASRALAIAAATLGIAAAIWAFVLRPRHVDAAAPPQERGLGSGRKS